MDPDLMGLTSMAWRRSDDLAERGYQAAEAMDGKLQGYAMTADAHAAFQAARQARRRLAPAVPTAITFQPLGTPISPRVEAEIRRALNRCSTRRSSPTTSRGISSRSPETIATSI